MTLDPGQHRIETLRDLWEGRLDRDTAIGMASLDYHPVVKAIAEAIWDNWEEAFDATA